MNRQTDLLDLSQERNTTTSSLLSTSLTVNHRPSTSTSTTLTAERVSLPKSGCVWCFGMQFVASHLVLSLLVIILASLSSLTFRTNWWRYSHQMLHHRPFVQFPSTATSKYNSAAAAAASSKFIISSTRRLLLQGGLERRRVTTYQQPYFNSLVAGILRHCYYSWTTITATATATTTTTAAAFPYNTGRLAFGSSSSGSVLTSVSTKAGCSLKRHHPQLPWKISTVLCSSSTSASGGQKATTKFAVPMEGSIDKKTTAKNGQDHSAVTQSDDVPQYSEYERWVRRLYATNMFHPVKLGLDNMRHLHELLGSPMDDPSRVVVHVAGTNGKGSVCLKIANTLQYQQHKDLPRKLNVGLFCSPHIASFRERMQVNGSMITEEEVVELLPKIYDLCIQHDIPATFFEITTALAFAFFAKRGADVVVLETGLGGRLDATNVISRPALTIITSIGLEHTRILGDTVELIAREKGGIIKPGCPVLVGPHCPHEVLQQCTKERNGGPYYLPSLVFGKLDDAAPRHTPSSDADEYTDYDIENQDVAKAALVLLKKSHPNLVNGLTEEQIDIGTSIRPPCRFQELSIDGPAQTKVILDVAHNPDAMVYLVRKLKTTYPDSSFRFVTGMSSDKDLSKCGTTLLSINGNDPTKIHLVEAAHPRAAKLEAILEAAPSLVDGSHYDLSDRSITSQVQNALSIASQNDEIVVICGSVFLMAEAREALGFDEPRDSDYISEMAGAGIRHGQENFGNSTMTDDDLTKTI